MLQFWALSLFDTVRLILEWVVLLGYISQLLLQFSHTLYFLFDQAVQRLDLLVEASYFFLQLIDLTVVKDFAVVLYSKHLILPLKSLLPLFCYLEQLQLQVAFIFLETIDEIICFGLVIF